jgi:hypothetical protein
MKERSGTVIVAVAIGTLLLAPAALAAGPPSVESESASHITPTGATLEAQVDPNGLETEYQFRVVAPPCLANPTNCSEGPDPLYPSTPSTIPAGSGAQPAGVNLHDAGLSLEPGHEYHYAVVAKNTEGTVAGPDQTFTTADVPSVVSETVTGVGSNDATLRAEINPGARGSAGAYYQFQAGEDPGAFAADLTCPPDLSSGPFVPCIGTHAAGALPISFLPSGSPARVSLDLAGAGVTLQAGKTYHFRVLVAPAVQTEDTIEWEDTLTVRGADQTFMTAVPGCPMSMMWPGSCAGPPEPVRCLATGGPRHCPVGPSPPCRRHRRHHRHHKHHAHHRHHRCHR